MLNDWRIIVFLCIFLGLAPFYPEPHLWGKLKWVAGGAQGMKGKDVFDLFLHGAPFLLLFRIVFLKLRRKIKK